MASILRSRTWERTIAAPWGTSSGRHLSREQLKRIGKVGLTRARSVRSRGHNSLVKKTNQSAELGAQLLVAPKGRPHGPGGGRSEVPTA